MRLQKLINRLSTGQFLWRAVGGSVHYGSGVTEHDQKKAPSLWGLGAWCRALPYRGASFGAPVCLSLLLSFANPPLSSFFNGSGRPKVPPIVVGSLSTTKNRGFFGGTERTFSAMSGGWGISPDPVGPGQRLPQKFRVRLRGGRGVRRGRGVRDPRGERARPQ